MSDEGEIWRNSATSAMAPLPGVWTSSGVPLPVGSISVTGESCEMAFSRLAA